MPVIVFHSFLSYTRLFTEVFCYYKKKFRLNTSLKKNMPQIREIMEKNYQLINNHKKYKFLSTFMNDILYDKNMMQNFFPCNCITKIILSDLCKCTKNWINQHIFRMTAYKNQDTLTGIFFLINKRK